MNAPAPQQPSQSIWRFGFSELTLLLSSDAKILERSGGTGAALVASSGLSSSSTAAVRATVGLDPQQARSFARQRRAIALWFTTLTVALPALPAFAGLVQLVLGQPDGVNLLLGGVVLAVPLAVIGLLVAAKLTAPVFRLLGVQMTTRPAEPPTP